MGHFILFYLWFYHFFSFYLGWEQPSVDRMETAKAIHHASCQQTHTGYSMEVVGESLKRLEMPAEFPKKGQRSTILGYKTYCLEDKAWLKTWYIRVEDDPQPTFKH